MNNLKKLLTIDHISKSYGAVQALKAVSFNLYQGVLDRRQMREQPATALRQLHINIPAPTLPVSSMSGGQQQAVAIGRAVTWGQELLRLDEPTAALGVEEAEANPG